MIDGFIISNNRNKRNANIAKNRFLKFPLVEYKDNGSNDIHIPITSSITICWGSSSPVLINVLDIVK